VKSRNSPKRKEAHLNSPGKRSMQMTGKEDITRFSGKLGSPKKQRNQSLSKPVGNNGFLGRGKPPPFREEVDSKKVGKKEKPKVVRTGFARIWEKSIFLAEGKPGKVTQRNPGRGQKKKKKKKKKQKRGDSWTLNTSDSKREGGNPEAGPDRKRKKRNKLLPCPLRTNSAGGKDSRGNFGKFFGSCPPPKVDPIEKKRRVRLGKKRPNGSPKVRAPKTPKSTIRVIGLLVGGRILGKKRPFFQPTTPGSPAGKGSPQGFPKHTLPPRMRPQKKAVRGEFAKEKDRSSSPRTRLGGGKKTSIGKAHRKKKKKTRGGGGGGGLFNELLKRSGEKKGVERELPDKDTQPRPEKVGFLRCENLKKEKRARVKKRGKKKKKKKATTLPILDQQPKKRKN